MLKVNWSTTEIQKRFTDTEDSKQKLNLTATGYKIEIEWFEQKLETALKAAKGE